MNNSNKWAIGCLVAPLLYLGFAFVGAWFIAPGAYPRAEKYELDVPEEALINIINKVKEENPQLALPDKLELKDGRRDSTDYYYSIYFYYKDKNQILHTWTRPVNDSTTTFAFVGINEGLKLGNWKTVNRSFWWWKNKPEVEEFEDRILKKIMEIKEN